MGSRLESWLQEAVADRARLARWFLVAYWISNAVMILGAILAIVHLAGRWRA